MTGSKTAGRRGDAKASDKKTFALTFAGHCGNLSLRCLLQDSYPVHAVFDRLDPPPVSTIVNTAQI
jgi:hypothetical protein